MKRVYFLSAILSAMTLVSLPTFAQAAPGGGDHMVAIFKELGVSAEQATTIKQIHAQAQPQIQAARATLHADRQRLHQQVAGSDAGDAQLMTMYTQVANDAATMHKLRFQMLLKVRAVLTPAQRQQAAVLMQQRHKQGGEGHDHNDITP